MAQTYRLMIGAHVAGRGENKKQYKQGDLIESEFDLTRFNSKNPANPKKFCRVYADGSTDYDGAHKPPPDPFLQRKGETAADYAKRMSDLAAELAAKAEEALERDAALDGMTVAQLREYAATNGIKIDADLVEKSDLIATIRGHAT